MRSYAFRDGVVKHVVYQAPAVVDEVPAPTQTRFFAPDAATEPRMGSPRRPRGVHEVRQVRRGGLAHAHV